MRFWSREKTEKQYPQETVEKGKKSIGMVLKSAAGLIKRRKRLVIILILFLCAMTGYLVIRHLRNRKPQIEPQKMIETTEIERMDLTNSIGITGTVASAEKKTGTTTLSNLKVMEVCVQVGDTVQEGDVICRFDSSDIEETLSVARNNYSVNQKINSIGNDYTTQYQDSVEQAEDTLQSARDKRDEAKSAYSSAAEQESAAKSAYEQAKANAAEKKTAYEQAKSAVQSAAETYETKKKGAGLGSGIQIKDLDAYLENLEQNPTADEIKGIEKEFEALISTKQVYEAAKKEYESAQGTENQSKSAYEQAKSSSSQAYSSYEQAQSAREDAQEVYEENLEKAGETYEKAKLNDQLITDNDEKQKIEDYEEQLENCTVRAAMSGVITSLSVEEGESFAGGTIYEVQDQSHFIINASVDEYDICDISKGMTAYVKTDSMGDEEMEGEVTYVATVGTSGSQTGSASGTASYEVEITIKGSQERLRPGMTAKVSISREESRNTLAVPYDCVQTNEAGESVLYIDDNGERKEIAVETGIETDYYTEVKSEELKEGMKVYLSTSMVQGTDSKDGVPQTDTEEGGLMNFGPGGNSGGGAAPGGGSPGGGGMPGGGGPGGF